MYFQKCEIKTANRKIVYEISSLGSQLVNMFLYIYGVSETRLVFSGALVLILHINGTIVSMLHICSIDWSFKVLVLP